MAAITLVIFCLALILFVADRLPMGLVAFMVPLALYFAGVIDTGEIFAPLIGKSIILIVAMCVIGAALFKTGMAEKLGDWLFRFCPGKRSLMFAVTVFSGIVSAFVSNTGTVAILIPIVMGVAATHRIKPSQLLIPLTGGATIGGNLSIIGTPGNLVAAQTIEQYSGGTMSVSFFEFANIGIPLLLATAAFYAFAGPKILPARDSAMADKFRANGETKITGKAIFTLITLIVTVAVMVASEHLKFLPPMHITACVGAVAIVLTGVLTQKEAFAAFDMQAVFLLAFMTPLGSAMVKTGAAKHIADIAISTVGGHGPLVLMAILWVAVWALTQVMSNTATCVLFCPIGWTIAKALGADPRAVVIAVLIASSVAVCTPLAIPANSLILEPGNLRFKDFFIPGLCLSAVAFVLCMFLLPLLYPFFP